MAWCSALVVQSTCWWKLGIINNFNTVMDPSLDSSNNSNSMCNCQSTDTIKQLMSDFGLVDGWQLKHPTAREFSFFLPVHHSYSRVDFFSTSNSIISKISNILIHPIIISDHAPVSLMGHMNHSCKPSNRWRFNTSLLDYHDFDNYTKRE